MKTNEDTFGHGLTPLTLRSKTDQGVGMSMSMYIYVSLCLWIKR